MGAVSVEFRIERRALADAVAWAGTSLPARTPVPVLGGLLLEAGDGRLRISGFDYEVSAAVEVPAETPVPGRALVLGRRLADVCRVLPDVTLRCALDGSRFAVDGGGTLFGLSTLPLHDYPVAPEPPAFQAAVDAAEFATAVAQVAVAASRDDTLPVLTGIQIRLDDERMTLASSDRYRYAVRTVPWKPEHPFPEPVDVVVPGRRLTEISKSLARTGLLRVGLNPSAAGLIAFEGGGMLTTLRLLEGRLPRYDRLFVLDGATVAFAEREPLADAVRRVAVVAEPNSPIRLDFSAEGSVLLQAGYEDDVASQRLPATLDGGADMATAFNPAYLLEALSSFSTPWVRFDLLGPGQRALLTGAADAAVPCPEASDPAPAPHRHLLMSLRPLA